MHCLQNEKLLRIPREMSSDNTGEDSCYTDNKNIKDENSLVKGFYSPTR